jgi:site-specific DNA recombinase
MSLAPSRQSSLRLSRLKMPIPTLRPPLHSNVASAMSWRPRATVWRNPIRKELLSPKRAERMATEMQAYFAERSQEEQARAAEQPHELQEISARIDRLRARLRQGDADMTTDELQVAIDRAESKKRELEDQRPGSLPGVNVLTFLPRAAELYRRQITLGLEGDPRATLKARMILRDLFGGEIRLIPQLDGGLTAHWNLHPGALLSGLGTNGSGGRI